MAKRERTDQIKGRWFLLMIVLLILVGYSIYFTEKVVKPTIVSVGEVKARAMVIQTINDVVRIKFTEDIQSADLLDIITDEEGKVSMVKADSAAMTQLAYDLATRIQNQMKSLGEERVVIPLGTIMGSHVLSQTGPRVRLKVMPLGTSKVSFNTEFEEAGINQTKYKIYLNVESKAKVLVPFSTNDIEVETALLVAETIIVGDVPQTYVFVPEDEIMDAFDNT
ncbi:MAG: sporulation protein YunB [Anaerovoracaceae bacterium]|jgi:sporulation protein YunB